MKQLLFILSLLSLFACNNAKQIVKYTQQQVLVKDDTCQTNDCTTVNFKYIRFEGMAADSLNKIVQEMIGSSYFNDSFVVYAPKENAEKFIAVYRESRDEFPDHAAVWTLDKDLRVDTIFKNVITLRYDESSFAGGAHGNYYTQFNHFQLKPFKVLWLADFLNQPQDTFQVIKIAESVFREQQKLGAYDDLEEAGFFFEKGIFRLNENFHFTDKGIEFHFNIYEIQPYANGEYGLLIPYKKVEHLINKKMLQPFNTSNLVTSIFQ
ncbi:MAG: DUF4163 domain-containing protein [Chitinophagales bacterium]